MMGDAADIGSQDLGESFGFPSLDGSAPPHHHLQAKDPDDEWQDDAASLSGSTHHSSGGEEDVFETSTRHTSPRTSSGSSRLSDHEDSWISQKPTSSPCTPYKTRSPFRNPSSVRAMQTDITPPRMSSSYTQPRNRFHTPSRQGTPRSNHSIHSAMRSSPRLSPEKKLKKEYPLVLLHVTIMPLPTHYSSEVLESALPPTVVANWKLLQEKTAPTVLQRGVLVPHPREDYDLLEERLLESLELKKARILKCGHFHLSPEEEADVLDNDSDDGSDAGDAGICEDCGRRIRDGSFGDAGTGSKRWDIKIFAANGLMRAGAWAAAWKDMERIDVEILPWMEDSMKQELELRREEDERIRIEHEQAAREERVGGLDDERLKEIYGQSAQEVNEAAGEGTSAPGGMSERRSALLKGEKELPLWDLLTKSLYITAQDPRNIAMFFLSALVLFLALRPGVQPPVLSNIPTTSSEGITKPPVGQITGPAKEVSCEAAASAQSVVVPRATIEPRDEEDEQETQSSWTESAEQAMQEILSD